ncbi:hypothetical protein [Streptomyces sp. NPDC020362]
MHAGTGAAGLLVVAGSLVAGCSDGYNDQRGKGGRPVRGRAGDDTPAEVYNFPDGFGNLATKCVGDGRRGCVTTKFFRQEDEDDVKIIPAHAVVEDPGCRVR